MLVLAEDDFFGDAAAEAAGQHVFELDKRDEHAVFWRDKPGDATSAAARDDGDFVDWIAIGQDVANQGVASFVVGGDLFVFFGHDLALALRADGYALKGFGDIVLGDFVMAVAGGDDGRLVGDVGQVGTR